MNEEVTNVGIQTEPQASVGKAPTLPSLAGLSLPKAKELAIMFRALADSTWVQTVSLSLVAGEAGLCVCNIVARFSLGQPSISHHLKVLKDADLLCARKKGLWVYYAVNRERLSNLGIALPMLSDSLERSWHKAYGCDTISDTKEIP